MTIQKIKDKLYKKKKTENQSLGDHERMNCNRRKTSVIWRESIFQLEERENEGFCRGVI
jgi:hypothetical protein